MKIKKGDNVIVLSGNDKGKKGEVLQVMNKENKVIVKGVNLRKKHVKPKKQGEQGGIISTECPINASKVNIVDPKTGKTTRIGYEMKDGKKVRIAKKSKQEIK